MSAAAVLRRPRVRLEDPISTPKPRRKRVRLFPTEAELIEEFLQTRGVTYCPTKAVEYVRNMYPIEREEARLRRLEVISEKDPNRVETIRAQRHRMQKKTEAWIELLKREGKPIPKRLAMLFGVM
jgi:hypothetical protein